MAKKTFTRKELVHKGIVTIRLCCFRYNAGNVNMCKKAFDIAESLLSLGIINYHKYALLMDIIERKFGF